MNLFNRNASSLAKTSGNILNGFKKAIEQYNKVNKQIALLEQKHVKRISLLEREQRALEAIRTSNEKQRSKIESFLE